MQDFTESDMFDGQPLVIEENKTEFSPIDRRQRQKNRNDKQKTTARKEALSNDEPRAPSGAQPEAPTAPTTESIDASDLASSLDDLLEGVPELFEASAKVSQAVQGVLPIKPMMATVLVAAAAVLASYLANGRHN